MRIYDVGFPITERMMDQLYQSGYTLLAHNSYNDTMFIALDIALRSVKQAAKKVLFFSTEAPIGDCLTIMHRRGVCIDRDKTCGNIIKVFSDIEELNGIAQNLKKGILFVYDKPRIYLEDIREAVQRVQKQCGIDMMVIDFLPMLYINGRYTSRHEELTAINTWLHCAAEEWNLPIVGTCLSTTIAAVNKDMA